jgi:hypothetical protein
MSEHEAETFETADAGASLTYPQQARSLCCSARAPVREQNELVPHALHPAAQRLRQDAALPRHWPCSRAQIGTARAAIRAGGRGVKPPFCLSCCSCSLSLPNAPLLSSTPSPLDENPTQAGSIRKNGFMVAKGRPCKVRERDALEREER